MHFAFTAEEEITSKTLTVTIAMRDIQETVTRQASITLDMAAAFSWNRDVTYDEEGGVNLPTSPTGIPEVVSLQAAPTLQPGAAWFVGGVQFTGSALHPTTGQEHRHNRTIALRMFQGKSAVYGAETTYSELLTDIGAGKLTKNTLATNRARGYPIASFITSREGLLLNELSDGGFFRANITLYIPKLPVRVRVVRRIPGQSPMPPAANMWAYSETYTEQKSVISFQYYFSGTGAPRLKSDGDPSYPVDTEFSYIIAADDPQATFSVSFGTAVNFGTATFDGVKTISAKFGVVGVHTINVTATNSLGSRIWPVAFRITPFAIDQLEPATAVRV
jgi:hypothetical protein